MVIIRISSSAAGLRSRRLCVTITWRYFRGIHWNCYRFEEDSQRFVYLSFVYRNAECFPSVDLLLSHSPAILELTRRCLGDEGRTYSLTKLAFGLIGDLADGFPLGQLKQLLLDAWVARALHSKSRMHTETKKSMRWAREVSTYFLCFLESIEMTHQHRWWESQQHSKCFGMMNRSGLLFSFPFSRSSVFVHHICFPPSSTHLTHACNLQS